MSNNQNTNEIILAEPQRLKTAMRAAEIVQRFEEVVGKGNAMGYISSVLVAVSQSDQLQKCEANSVIGSALRAATMRLSVDPAVAHAYLVPFNSKVVENGITRWVLKAQFLVGYKGYMYMCIRTERYKYLHLTDIYADDVVTENPVTGEIFLKRGSVSIVADRNSKIGVAPVGHLLYMELKTGYKAWFFMTTQECDHHGQKYSPSYYNKDGSVNKNSKWYTDPISMHRKTVVRQGITKYGYLDPQDLTNLGSYDDVDETQEDQDYLKGVVIQDITPTAEQSMADLGITPAGNNQEEKPAADQQGEQSGQAPEPEKEPLQGSMTFEEAATVKSVDGGLYIAMSDKDLKAASKNLEEQLKGSLDQKAQDSCLLRLEAVRLILAARNNTADQPKLV